MLYTRTLKTLFGLILLLALIIPAGIASASKPNVTNAQSAFTKYGPGNGASVSSSSVTIVWGSSTGATSYQYCYDTVNNSTCDSSWNYVGTSTMASLSGLSNGTTYYWQARANGSSGSVDANGGTWWSFVVSIVPPTATPVPFGKSTPANGATNQQVSSQLIAWSASSGATGYEYCVDTSNNGTCDSPSTWVSTGTSQYAFVNGLSYSTTYYWQARTAGGSAYANGSSNWWAFTTGVAPTRTPTATTSPAFVKYGPGNGSSVQSSTIVWGSSYGVSQYQYCYDTTNNNNCDTSWTSNGTSTVANLSLSMNIVYYWEVRAINGSGVTTYADGGTWWSFTVTPTPTPTMTPLVFGKSNPANGGVWSSGSPLAWVANSSATSYDYCFDTINNGACDTSWITTTSTYAFVTFAAHSSYSWQVRANTPGGVVYANSNTWWTFTTP